MLLLTILALSSITIFTPSTQADDKYHHTTYILVAAEPSPIGVGQTIYLTYLIENVPPAVLPTNAPKFYYWSGITVTITLPDGTTKTVTGLTLPMQVQAPTPMSQHKSAIIVSKQVLQEKQYLQDPTLA